MPLPSTRLGLEGQGYVYQGESRCKGCGVPLLWYTTPKGNRMPFHIQAGTEDAEHRVLVCHFGQCPNAKDFRKDKKKKK